MNDNIVLWTAIGSNPDPPVVTAKHRSLPNPTSRADYHVTADTRLGSPHGHRIDSWVLGTVLIRMRISSIERLEDERSSTKIRRTFLTACTKIRKKTHGGPLSQRRVDQLVSGSVPCRVQYVPARIRSKRLAATPKCKLYAWTFGPYGGERL